MCVCVFSTNGISVSQTNPYHRFQTHCRHIVTHAQIECVCVVNEDVLIDLTAVISWSVKAWKGLRSGGSVPSGETLNCAMHHYVTHTHHRKSPIQISDAG